APTSNVEVIGLWLEEQSVGATPIGWVNATGNGIPQRLEEPTRAIARPAIVAVGGDNPGYLMAYWTGPSSVFIRFVEPLNNLTPVSQPPPAKARRTSPLVLGNQKALLPASPQALVDHVSLVVSAVNGVEAMLGVSWQEGCGENASIWFSPLRYEFAT